MDINGMAHVILSVRDLPASARFYRPLLEHMGLTQVADQNDFLYYVGGRTAPARSTWARAAAASQLVT